MADTVNNHITHLSGDYSILFLRENCIILSKGATLVAKGLASEKVLKGTSKIGHPGPFAAAAWINLVTLNLALTTLGAVCKFLTPILRFWIRWQSGRRGDDIAGRKAETSIADILGLVRSRCCWSYFWIKYYKRGLNRTNIMLSTVKS